MMPMSAGCVSKLNHDSTATTDCLLLVAVLSMLRLRRSRYRSAGLTNPVVSNYWNDRLTG